MSLGLSLEVQQELMRHADIETTLQYGRSSMLNGTRPANAQLVAMLGCRTDAGRELATLTGNARRIRMQG